MRSMQGLARQPIARVAGQMRAFPRDERVRVSRRCSSCNTTGEDVQLVDARALCPRCTTER